ncbi:MAG: hypothetical protein ACTSPY_10325 [Candidatus Helarchaeota archaeon]
MFHYKQNKYFNTIFIASIILSSVVLMTSFMFLATTRISLQNSTSYPISIEQTYTVNTAADLIALNNNLSFSENVEIKPTENIVAELKNFSMAALKDFYVFGNSTYSININITDCNFTRGFAIYGNPIVNITNCIFDKSNGFAVYSGGATLRIKDSTLLGKFATNRFEFGDSIDSLNLIINNTFFNQTSQDYGYIKIRVSAGSSVEIDNTNATNTIMLIGVNTVSIDNCIIGSNTISNLVERQGIYLKSVNNFDINNSDINYDSGSIKPQGLFLDNSNNGIVQNVNIAKDFNITSCSNIVISDISINNLFYIDPSSSISVSNIPTSFNLLDIYSSDISLTSINVNDIDIHGSNQDITITDSTITNDIDIDCTSNTNIILRSLTLQDLSANGLTSSVSLIINDSSLSSLTLLGSIITRLNNNTITGNLHVYSTSNTYIETTTYGTLYDHVNPNIQVDQNTFHFSYDIVLDTSKIITLSWNGSDNIIGTLFTLSYRILIYQDSVLILNTTTTQTSYILQASTGSSYIIKVNCIDYSGNNSNSASISVSFMPTLGTFLLILVIVILSCAAAAAVVVFYLYHRAKNRWKKTTILSVPSEKK